jgi:molybdate transport system permease protein
MPRSRMGLRPRGVDRMDRQTIDVTLALAAATTSLLAIVGIPIGYWLATSRSRWRPLIDALVALPLVLPPTVLGFYLLRGTGPGSLVGRVYEALTGGMLPFSFAGLLVASVIYNLPFAVRPFAAGFAGVDRRLIDAARCLGSSPLRAFARIVIPLSWPGLLAGLVLTFTHTIGEFGVVLMMGGSIPGVTRTLSLAIYDDVQALNYGAAADASLALLMLAFSTLAIMYTLQRRAFPL